MNSLRMNSLPDLKPLTSHLVVLALLGGILTSGGASAYPQLPEGEQKKLLTTDTDSSPKQIRKAVEKSIQLLEKSSAEYLKHRECFSCHHQAMPIVALKFLQRRGVTIDQDNIAAQVNHIRKNLLKNQTQLENGKGIGGQVDSAGYALWGLISADQSADDLTDVIVSYLIARQPKLPYWKKSGQRPPSEASHFTTTFVALQALSRYARGKHKQAMRNRISSAETWLKTEAPRDTEDRVFLLRGLRSIQRLKKADSKQKGLEDDPKNSKIKELISQQAALLVDQQHEDGGWSQTEKMQSDAYATGTVLMTLIELEHLRPHDPVVLKGIQFLMKTRKPDGSWYVKSRSDPFQEYFETGFPHQTDQFISISATCWAAMALGTQIPLSKKSPAKNHKSKSQVKKN